MKRPFVLLRTAECDLDGIVEYLQANAGRAKAVDFVERIHAALELLGKRPNLGFQAVPPAERYRIWPVKPYIIVY